MVLMLIITFTACFVAITMTVLAWRVLRAFPGAARAVRPWVLLLIVLSTALAVMGPPRTYAHIAEWQPRALIGVMWLFALTSVAMLWYRLPVRLWHRALLFGFSTYMVFFVGMLQLLHIQASWVGLADGGVYLVLTCYWAMAAWRPDHVPTGVPAFVLRRLGLETS